MPIPFVDQGSKTVPADLRQAVWGMIQRYMADNGSDLMLAEQHGYLGETYDPAAASGTFQPNTGVLYVMRFQAPKAATISSLWVNVTTAGSGLTSGQNLLGLYTDGGVKLSDSADQTTPWASTGSKQANLTAAQAVTAGTFYRAVLLSVGTTIPIFRSGVQAQSTSIAQSGGSIRFGVGPGSQTSLPASIDLSALTAQFAALLVVAT